MEKKNDRDRSKGTPLKKIYGSPGKQLQSAKKETQACCAICTPPTRKDFPSCSDSIRPTEVFQIMAKKKLTKSGFFSRESDDKLLGLGYTNENIVKTLP